MRPMRDRRPERSGAGARRWRAWLLLLGVLGVAALAGWFAFPVIQAALGGNDVLLAPTAYASASATDVQNVNGVGYRNPAIFTTPVPLQGKRYQAAGWWDAHGQLVLAVREENASRWEKHTYNGITISGDDDHNAVVLIVDKRGELHVWYDLHNADMAGRYKVSAEPLGSWRGVLRDGPAVPAPTSSVTYPMPFLDAANDLHLVYRNGASGSGDIYLKDYDADARSWSSNPTAGYQGKLFDGLNSVRDGEDQSVYLQAPPAVGPDGSWHFAYWWRDTADPMTDHTLAYLRFDPAAGAWTKADGSAVAVPVTFVDDDAAALDVVDPIPVGDAGLTGQHGVAVDADNTPFIAYTKTVNNTVHLALAHRGDDGWRVDLLRDSYGQYHNGDSAIAPNAKVVIAREAGRGYVLYRGLGEPEPGLYAYRFDVDDPLGSLQRLQLTDLDVGLYNPVPDPVQWRERGRLDLLVTVYPPRSVDPAKNPVRAMRFGVGAAKVLPDDARTPVVGADPMVDGLRFRLSETAAVPVTNEGDGAGHEVTPYYDFQRGGDFTLVALYRAGHQSDRALVALASDGNVPGVRDASLPLVKFGTGRSSVSRMRMLVRAEDGTVALDAESEVAVPSNRWTMQSIVVDDGAYAFYHDRGEPAGSGAYPEVVPVTSRLAVGAILREEWSSQLRGDLAEVLVYDRPKTERELQLIYDTLRGDPELQARGVGLR